MGGVYGRRMYSPPSRPVACFAATQIPESREYALESPPPPHTLTFEQGNTNAVEEISELLSTN
jgi:hypothetical protein